MLRRISLFLVLFVSGPICAQDSISRDSLLLVIETLRSEKTAAPPATTPIYSAQERLMDSLRLSITTPGTDYEREKAKADRMWPLAMRCILLGAGVFLLWAFLYRKRYRELHTRNGIYYGIGSKYYHDHIEQEHYNGSRYGPSAGEDPWCYNERYSTRHDPLPPGGKSGRDELKNRSGNGASGSW